MTIRLLYRHLQHHNNTIIKTQEDFFNKIYLSLCCKDSKRVTQSLRVRGSYSYGRQRCVFLVLLMLQPETQRPSSLLDDGFLYCILSASSLDPNSSGPQAPSAWCGFPYHISSITPSPTVTRPRTVLTSVLTELYNRSTPTRSPTRSLKWHVWSSSSGNNCHALFQCTITVMLSSSASVYECTMGIFTSSHFISQFPPTRFPLITAIRMCHFLPVHHLGMAFLAGSKTKIQHDHTISYAHFTFYSSAIFQSLLRRFE